MKTRNARRRVPVHPELEALGLLAHWESCSKQGHEFLFPDLKADVAGKRSGNWSKWFGRYKRTHGSTDERKVFHSFRHGLAKGVECLARPRSGRRGARFATWRGPSPAASGPASSGGKRALAIDFLRRVIGA